MNNSQFSNLLQQYHQYLDTRVLDDIRERDFQRLGLQNHVYLDYTGGCLYPDSLVESHQARLVTGIYGNPHSSNPSSRASTELVEETRSRILRYFRAVEDEYVVIFASNASGALKLVGEAYPFGKDCTYLLTFDNHNSVNGIREYAWAKGAQVRYLPVLPPRMRVDEIKLEEFLVSNQKGCNNLFAFPAQSNFSAVHHPLEWIEKAHAQGWDVLLDAAAFAPTNRLDLSVYKPDFVPISFYKMFGFPTGVGALIARKAVLSKLHRPWFAGGTITVASVQGEKHYMAQAPAAFEDGTLDYLNIPAVKDGLDYLDGIGIETIHERVLCLTGWMLSKLIGFQHSSGKPLVKIYGPVDTDRRGGAIALNFFDHQGNVIDHRWIEEMASRENISLRTGCFCNPGAGEVALEISSGELSACFNRPDHGQRLTYDEFRLCLNNKASGAVRVSVGLVSNFSDIERFLEFVVRLVR